MTDWYDSTVSATLTVRVGSGGAIETNPDPSDSGNTWTVQTSGTVENLYGIAFNGIGFVAVGATGIGLYSTDAISWLQVTTQSAEDLNSVAAGGNVFIAVGNVGTMVQSQNGTVWTTITSGITDDLWDIAIGNGAYVAVGDNDAVVVGSVTSTVLQVHLLESVVTNAGLLETGTFNQALTDGITTDERTIRTKDIADAYVYQFVNEGITFDQDMVQDVGGDPQTGTDESISGTSSPVVEEGINATSNDSMILGGAGSGQPSFITQTEGLFVTQLGNFVDAKFNAALLDSTGLHDRLFLNTVMALRETIAVADTNTADYHKLVADSFGVDDPYAISVLFNMVTSDTVAVDETVVCNGFFIMVADENIATGETLTSTQMLDLIITESLEAIAGFTLGADGTYLGVVMNTKNRAITEYEDFDFNSLGKYNKQYYGCKPDGIYLLNGADDAGTAIAAMAKSGLRRMSKDKYTRMDRAYIGLRNSGSLVLKTIVRDRDGKKRERWYETNNTSDTIRDIRIKLAKGVKAHYWQWELVNEAGSDFELDTLELREIKMTRRI